MNIESGKHGTYHMQYIQMSSLEKSRENDWMNENIEEELESWTVQIVECEMVTTESGCW